MVADQVFAGLFGAIIVEDPEPVPVSTERVLVISDTTMDGGGTCPRSAVERMLGREGELVLVNGQSNPQAHRPAGPARAVAHRQRLHARYLPLRLDGQQVQLLGMDSGRFRSPRA